MNFVQKHAVKLAVAAGTVITGYVGYKIIQNYGDAAKAKKEFMNKQEAEYDARIKTENEAKTKAAESHDKKAKEEKKTA